MTKLFKSTALALAASSVVLAAVPAEAKHNKHGRYSQYDNRYNDAYGNNGYNNGYTNNGYYAEPVYNNTRVWQGRDGSYYCQKKDGTTGLIIGGAVGALLGREIAGRGDRTLGTILGAAGGAILGQKVAQGTRCQ